MDCNREIDSVWVGRCERRFGIKKKMTRLGVDMVRRRKKRKKSLGDKFEDLRGEGGRGVRGKEGERKDES